MPLTSQADEVVTKLRRLIKYSRDQGAKPVEIVLSPRGQAALFEFFVSLGQRHGYFQPLFDGLIWRVDVRQREPFRVPLSP